MFFFTRYPSSALLRQHFPDVKFNRHNTSQIIKWFSNFREFYYIQMEKFARQSVSDNVETAEDLKVTRDSELYRSLNLHYNKSNEFTVSPFLCVCVGFETYSYLRMFLSFLYQSLMLFNSLWLSMFVTILFFFLHIAAISGNLEQILWKFSWNWMHTKNGISLCASALFLWIFVLFVSLFIPLFGQIAPLQMKTQGY